jgi:inner membrane protein
MATLLTHALLGASIGHAAKPRSLNSAGFWGIAAFCSMLPDIDVIGFRMGVPYSALWGHRGMTHSLFFAAIVASLVAFALSRNLREGTKTALLLFVIVASHGVLDAMTNGGLGVAFFAPFDTRRYFLPWRPIAVSPIGIGRAFSARSLHIVWTEMVWLWAPIAALTILLWLLRRTTAEAGPVVPAPAVRADAGRNQVN